jgi:arylsulfatase A-like enzyme
MAASVMAVELESQAKSPAESRALADSRKPNIVFVLTDDMSWDLVRFMPQLRAMQREGTTFGQFIVADSLCCSSRASILTGQFPHNTKVRRNVGWHGGYQAFEGWGAQRRSVGRALRRAGYRTAMLGKYLNGYKPSSRRVPRGWSEWLATGHGGSYDAFDYKLSHNGRPVRFGNRPADYLTDVLRRRGLAFMRSAAQAGEPFFAVFSPVAPHCVPRLNPRKIGECRHPPVPAPRHADLFPGLRMPRVGAFNRTNLNPPSWLRGRRLSRPRLAALDREYRRRAQSLRAVDELLGAIRRQLARDGLSDSTYVVFSSDNGYHMASHGLVTGKRTAFDTDIRVPTVIAGPGVGAGASVSALAANVDLAPTFLAMAREDPGPDRDGRSLLPLLSGETPADWRRAMLIEHRGGPRGRRDPDPQTADARVDPTYRALRTERATYVRYANGDREYYDRWSDPWEQHNRAADLIPTQIETLDLALARLAACHGAVECHAADQGEGLAGVMAARVGRIR